jgi:hypothetical protein
MASHLLVLSMSRVTTSQRKDIGVTKTKTKRKEATVQVAYKLPVSLDRRIRMEAAKRGIWPAHVVAERLSQSYDDGSSKPAK